MTFNKINNLQIFQKKVRKTGKKRIPQSGFDIVLDENIVHNGLNEIKIRRAY